MLSYQTRLIMYIRVHDPDLLRRLQGRNSRPVVQPRPRDPVGIYFPGYNQSTRGYMLLMFVFHQGRRQESHQMPAPALEDSRRDQVLWTSEGRTEQHVGRKSLRAICGQVHQVLLHQQGEKYAQRDGSILAGDEHVVRITFWDQEVLLSLTTAIRSICMYSYRRVSYFEVLSVFA